MKPLSGHEIRRRWIAFFESKGHLYVPGVPLLPKDDKSLLFVNAGVTGLKKYFDGREVPPCRRLVNVQKSIRTNDIENVGHTARHHTFFEMLGNFSIGDYFRKEVIPWAVEILTDPDKGFGLPIDKLYVTYNPSDLDSYRLWQEHGLAKDHLIPLESNYWEIGEGPCGPNTEVFYDRGEAYDPEHLGIKLLEDDMENDRYIELWGIVFSQFNAKAGQKRSEYAELPSKNIDTGAGLERIACILQGTPTNFETDLFMPIIEEAEKESGLKYEGNELSFRVIADHARCLTFALSDGARFSNEGRGYVLRRIIRRAMRYARKIGITDPFIHTLVPVVTKAFSDFYPDLKDHEAEDIALIKAEEEKFIHTLNAGEEMLSKRLKQEGNLSGEEVFRLYDTYGFPSDLTLEIAREAGKDCDMEGFTKCLEEAREKSREKQSAVTSFASQSADLLSFTEPSDFLYHGDKAEAKCIGLFKDGKAVEYIDHEGEACFDKTPFYAEMGGQTYDEGTISGEGFMAKVKSVTKAPRGQHLHTIEVLEGKMEAGKKYLLEIDTVRRRKVEGNHSATHLLHAALSNRFGHVRQEGSFVGPDYLRFDYSIDRKPSEEDLSAVEGEVNEKIGEGLDCVTEIMGLEEAKKSGAEAEFGEKYGSRVRVVSFGDYSKELCGGTHVSNSRDIGLFVIASDEAISSGVRRIGALTGSAAYLYLRKKSLLLAKVEKHLDATDADLLYRLTLRDEQLKTLEKELSSLKEKGAGAKANELIEQAEDIDGIRFVHLYEEGKGREELGRYSDAIKAKCPDSFAFLIGGKAPKYDVLVSSSGKALKKLGAGEALKAVMPLLSGRGGGKPEFAGGSASDLSRLEEALALIRGKLG